MVIWWFDAEFMVMLPCSWDFMLIVMVPSVTRVAGIFACPHSSELQPAEWKMVDGVLFSVDLMVALW